MTTVELQGAQIVAGRGDAIRIVPLHVPEGHTAFATLGSVAATLPRLTYRNGPLLTNVEVFTLFWGGPWASSEKALSNQINQFFTFVLSSPLIDQLSEYSVPGQTIGHGKLVGTRVVQGPKLGRSVTDSAIQHMLQSEIASNAVTPQPTRNTLYFIYLSPGVRAVQGGSASCTGFCGYHSDISGQIFYAVMPYPGCKGCTGSLSVLDALTSTSSHELCEAITDPVPGQGWYDDANGEIGDICAWKTKKLGPWTVQLEWSNTSASCV